eukprot:1415416-Amphidinium_carterae.1
MRNNGGKCAFFPIKSQLSALSPINNANERVLQIIPSDAFDLAQDNPPFNMRRCIVPPQMENNDWMTWHDRGAGTHNPRIATCASPCLPL